MTGWLVWDVQGKEGIGRDSVQRTVEVIRFKYFTVICALFYSKGYVDNEFVVNSRLLKQMRVAVRSPFRGLCSKSEALRLLLPNAQHVPLLIALPVIDLSCWYCTRGTQIRWWRCNHSWNRCSKAFSSQSLSLSLANT